MKVTSYGGAGGVTGSKHLLEISTYRVLLDCGMFQGHRREAQRLNSDLPFDVKSIDAVVLSHGHLDHCGMLPLLVKKGYAGKIFSTGGTRDVAEWILKDAAHIQAQDADYMNRHKIEGARNAEPLFSEEDVAATMARFVTVPYVRESKAWFSIAPGLHLKFYDAGHILGSAVTVIEALEQNTPVRVAFSGDLGRCNTPLLPDPEFVTDQVSLLLLESTYGDRLHQPVAEAASRLINIISETAKRGGKIIVPSFALGRTQELIYVLHKLTDEGKLPRIPMYVDSPLASKITEVFVRHPENYDRESWDEFGSRGELPLAFRNLSFVHTVDESKRLNRAPGPFLVISASGMCEAGRILHHLSNSVTDDKNVVLITGFQAQHTLGRRLVEGERSIRIFGDRYNVRCRVEVLNEFSAHADAAELMHYAEHVPGLQQVLLVHGEQHSASSLAEHLARAHPNWKVSAAEPGVTIIQ